MEKGAFIKVYINIKQPLFSLPLFRIARTPSPQSVRAIFALKITVGDIISGASSSKANGANSLENKTCKRNNIREIGDTVLVLHYVFRKVKIRKLAIRLHIIKGSSNLVKLNRV